MRHSVRAAENNGLMYVPNFTCDPRCRMQASLLIVHPIEESQARADTIAIIRVWLPTHPRANGSIGLLQENRVIAAALFEIASAIQGLRLVVLLIDQQANRFSAFQEMAA